MDSPPVPSPSVMSWAAKVRAKKGCKKVSHISHINMDVGQNGRPRGPQMLV